MDTISHTITSRIETNDCDVVVVKTNEVASWFDIEYADTTLSLPKKMIPLLVKALQKQEEIIP